jgi:hypothetical protein
VFKYVFIRVGKIFLGFISILWLWTWKQGVWVLVAFLPLTFQRNLSAFLSFWWAMGLAMAMGLGLFLSATLGFGVHNVSITD